MIPVRKVLKRQARPRIKCMKHSDNSTSFCVWTMEINPILNSWCPVSGVSETMALICSCSRFILVKQAYLYLTKVFQPHMRAQPIAGTLSCSLLHLDRCDIAVSWWYLPYVRHCILTWQFSIFLTWNVDIKAKAFTVSDITDWLK
jgi:hypothetical protein